jgi:steroid delta-isomerase-like uncharacterized protein
MQRSSASFGRVARRGAAAVLIFAAVVLPRAGLADPLAVVEAYVAAWNAHDAAAAAGHLAEDVTYYDASVGTPQVGRDAARTNVIEAFLNAAPDAKWERSGDPVVSGDAVAFEWVFSGTNTGAWADGTAATGKPFSIHGLSLFRLAGEEIAYQGDYYDALGFYKQLGLN